MNHPTRTTLTPGQTVTEKHPIRGFFWGLLMGIGLALVAIITKVVSLSLTTSIVLVAVCIVFGVLWGVYAPPRAPQGPAPAPRTVVSAEVSRFDDFDAAASTDDDRAPLNVASEPVASDDSSGGGAGSGDD